VVEPRTVYIEHGKIHKFAQDGAFLAWIGGKQYVVHLRGVSGGRSWVLGHAGVGAAVGAQSASTLVLGGQRAVWVKYAGVMTREAGVFSAKPGQKKPTLVDALGVSGTYGTGRYLAGLAGDGEGTILYGDTTLQCDLRKNCTDWSITGGGVHRIFGTKSVFPPSIEGIPPAFDLAVSAGKIAVVPSAVTDTQRGEWGAAPNGPVDVYDLSGHRLTRVTPQGTLREVALSWPDLAVIVARPDGTIVVEHYDAAKGELVTATRMPGASTLAIGTGGIVFLVGKSIYTLHDGQPALLWRATVKPIGLSIEGRRVAWAALGRVKALTLPR
jgi:hypothetical protein